MRHPYTGRLDANECVEILELLADFTIEGDQGPVGTLRRLLALVRGPVCEVCQKPVREGLRFCAGLSECFLR